ncbi:FtsW/RodA/SpoVE family cell cycle protein [Hespellia stercorisuis]|uniref:Cell division protein FtsW, lipid II flippase n=1 Tax=Hespellia stercorisuis DSM 15480 TaxID=1121950 RepID=A0A1M6HGJ5_9FIRM|nr:FtsW/RodA/SpoVE family cell cycle protein [Hespellia stercorisuis]SHJ21338.1 cell division protein FtsW, lipid II flippase [Hespellia stercorisuis DSM 15480]
MVNIVVELSKYLMIALMAAYTFECFSVFAHRDIYRKKSILFNQNKLMFLIQFIAYLVMYLKTLEIKLVFFYLAQVVLLVATIALYTLIYPRVSRLIVNNMCMLLCIGLIMITRLTYTKATKQFIIIVVSMAISLVVPVVIRKLTFLERYGYFYAIVGMLALALVAIIGKTSDGAKLGFSIAGFGIQPSEFVKILFVFFVASSFKKSTAFKDIVKTTIFAAVHVLILVASTDLGAALIIFVVYLVMLYVATRQPLYMLAGLAAGSGAAVVAYHLFSHVQTRVTVWRDPFAVYQSGGYQVAQSLFAIATGSWFGMGLYQGNPTDIPVAEEDFIFSAISEEMGLIFALCLILVCVSCYIMFLNIAMQLRNRFYKLVALGLGTCYIFQVFLTIGGVTKFIPSTGVTLPLVSYGGSSVLSTLIMFGIIQGLYILREDEEEIIEKRKEEELRGVARRAPQTGQGTAQKRKKKATKFEEIEKQRIR